MHRAGQVPGVDREGGGAQGLADQQPAEDVWGSDEANEGMNAFLAGRKPDFQKFRMKAKRELEQYVDGYEKDLNAPPSMRKKR